MLVGPLAFLNTVGNTENCTTNLFARFASVLLLLEELQSELVLLLLVKLLELLLQNSSYNKHDLASRVLMTVQRDL